jgi:hypothetical protein
MQQVRTEYYFLWFLFVHAAMLLPRAISKRMPYPL